MAMDLLKVVHASLAMKLERDDAAHLKAQKATRREKRRHDKKLLSIRQELRAALEASHNQVENDFRELRASE